MMILSASIVTKPSAPPSATLRAATPAHDAEYKLHVKRRRFVLVYLAALCIAFSPSKAAGFVAPFIIIAALIFYVQLRPNFHLQKLFLFGVVYSFMGLLYWLLLPEFWWPNYLLAIVTFASVFFLLFDFSRLLDVHFMRRLGRITLLFIFIEAAYGILQFLLAVRTYGYHVSIGDFVWGTLAPPNDGGYAGTSPFFILLISTLLLFVFAVTPVKMSLPTLIGQCTVALCWVLASLVHSIVFFVFAVVMAIATTALIKPRRGQRKYRRGIIVALLAVLLLFAVGLFVHPSNFQRVQSTLVTIQSFGPTTKNGKLLVIYQTIFEVPKDVWVQPVIGTGPGQYSSRAAMIARGDYLSRASIPFLPKYTSELTGTYIMPAYYQSNSTSDSPISSWIAVYGEFGMLGWGMLLLLLFIAMMRFGRVAVPEFPRFGYAMLILVFYLFFMGFQNVYWEYTQGIFPAVLLLKVSYDFVRLRQRKWVPMPDEVNTQANAGQQKTAPLALPTHLA